MGIKLKPCPFCGGKASIEIRYGALPTKYIMCENCKATTGFYAYVCSNEKISEFWNMRKFEKEGK